MLDLRKTLTLLVLLPVCCIPAHSQRPDSFWRKIVDVISAPSMELDPGAVYQPAPRWSVAVSGELHQAGITQENTFDYISSYDVDFGGDPELLQAYVSTKLLGGVEFSDEDIKFDKIRSSGRFSRWSASLKLCVKF